MTNPVNATSSSPLLPPEAWYKSEVQVRAVVALGAQLISIILRIIGHFTEVSITTDQIDLLVADITQGVAVVFGYLAITKRKDSPIQPLTLTAAKAEERSESAQLDPKTMKPVNDPSTDQKTERFQVPGQGGFTTLKSLAILTVVSISGVSFLTACVNLKEDGVEKPDAVVIACENGNPSEFRFEQCAYALYGRFVTFQQIGARIIETPGTSESIKDSVKGMDRTAKPIADSLLETAIEVLNVRRELRAGTSTEEKLEIANANLERWIATAYPRLVNLIDRVEAL